MDDRLSEIIAKGSPAQAAMARQLTASGCHQQIDLLFDAYLHDPYLTR